MKGAWNSADEVKVGETVVRLEPPDILYFEVVGGPAIDEAIKIMDGAARLAEGKAHLFVLSNIARSSDFPPDARKLVADRLTTLPVRATALFGGSFQVRVLITLVYAIRDLIKGGAKSPTRFCANETEARAWLDEQRARIKRTG